MRPLLLFVLLASLVSCGNEKRLKECLNRCASETEACERRDELKCTERGRECAQACERKHAK
jgi:hypothetical protein